MSQPIESSPALGSNPHRVGRRPRIDRLMIAQAASEVGLDRLTMKAVAAHLGVSVAGLYHHVQGREELVQLGAEYSAAQMPLPMDQGQDWTAWLLEWAHYVYSAFVAQPALLNQFITGSISLQVMAPHMDAVVEVLTRQGFIPTDAKNAYVLICNCSLGAAVTEIRIVEAARSGRPVLIEHSRTPAHERDDALPKPRTITSSARLTKDQLTDRIRTILIGIAVRRGEDWTPILDLTLTAPRSTPDFGAMHP